MRGPWFLGFVESMALAAATIPPIWPGLGAPAWHHTVSLNVSLALFVAFVYLGRDNMRRHMALGVAWWTLLALVSGFLILYLKPGLKETGYKDWAKFWHIAWSWLSLWYGTGHLLFNLKGLRRAWNRWNTTWTGRVLSTGAIALVLAAIPLTWSSWGARVLQEPQFIPLTLWTWVAFLTIPYAIWIAYVKLRADGAPAWMKRPAVQRFVDLWLTPMTLLANLSGLPLVYAGTKDTSLKYVAKYWHVWPSIAMAVLVFAHTIQFWPALARHWALKRQA